MTEDRKCCCCPLGLIEAQLAIIIVLLSVFLVSFCVDDKPKKPKDKKDN